MRKFQLTIVMILGLLISGCVTPQTPSTGTRPNSLSALCQEYGIMMNWDTVSPVVTLSKNNLTAKLLVGSDLVMLGSEKIILNASIRRAQGGIYVPPDFKSKVIERFSPTTGRQDYSLKKFREIIVDAGHGGKDPGARGRGGLEEKDVVLDIAKRLKGELEQKGINVILTRNNDEFISLKERTEIASRSKADLFVSIHANSSRQRSAKGFEVYYLRELHHWEKKEDELRDNHRIKFRSMDMDRGAPILENILSDMMYNYKQAESRKLAEFITMKTPHSLDTEGRGSKSCAFFVLKNNLIPAVLVEVGFVSNPKEEKLLKTGAYRQKIADSLAKHIVEYANKE